MPKVFWPALAVGWAMIGVGIVGVLGEGRDVPAPAFGRWVIGVALTHDFVLVPIVLLVGTLLKRGLRPPWRAIVGAALIVAGQVVLFAWPYVTGWGRSRSNRSIQPRDYGDGLTVVLAIVFAATVAVCLAVVARRLRARTAG